MPSSEKAEIIKGNQSEKCMRVLQKQPYRVEEEIRRFLSTMLFILQGFRKDQGRLEIKRLDN